MSPLEIYYKENADQARQHEGHRERMTNIILAAAGLLVGLVTFSKLSLLALPAALTVFVLGILGFLFAGKHYERFRLHSAIMGKIRDEMDRLQGTPGALPFALSVLRSEGEKDHYGEFRWPKFGGSGKRSQMTSKCWIARQRLHVFWESIHILVALLGLILTVVIIAKAVRGSEDEPMKVQVVRVNSSWSRL